MLLRRIDPLLLESQLKARSGEHFEDIHSARRIVSPSFTHNYPIYIYVIIMSVLKFGPETTG